MIYVSIDIETTSLVPHPDHILQVAMVKEDTELADTVPVEELPYFCCFIDQPEIKGQAYALQMNAWILKLLAKVEKASPHPIYDVTDWQLKALGWLKEQIPSGKITAAGKNVGTFDLLFLPPLIKHLFSHRVIDVGSVFIDWTKPKLPSLGEVLGREPAHDALEDARDVIRALRQKYAGTGA